MLRARTCIITVALVALLSALLAPPPDPSLAGGAAVNARLAADLAIAQAPGDQFQPVVAHNAQQDEYLVVWLDRRNIPAGSTAEVYGQRVANDGTQMLGNLPIASGPATIDKLDIAYNSKANEYLVAWSGQPTGKVYGQRVGATGDLLGGRSTLLDVSWSLGDSISVAYNSSRDEYLLVVDSTPIQGQRLTATGTCIGSYFTVYAMGSGTVGSPDVVYNPLTSQYLVVCDTPGTLNEMLGAQRVSGTGTLLGAQITVAGAPGAHEEPAVTVNATTGEYLVVWQRGTYWEQSIEAQRLSSTGELQGGRTVLSSTSYYLPRPAVGYAPGVHQYLVVWRAAQGVSPSGKVMAQRLSASAAVVGEAVCAADTASSWPARVASGTDRHLLVWTDGRENNTDIYGRLDLDLGACSTPTATPTATPAPTATPTHSATPAGRICLPIVQRNARGSAATPTPSRTPLPTPTGTIPAECQVRLYLRSEEGVDWLSRDPVSEGIIQRYLYVGSPVEWSTTLTGDFTGNRYGFSLMLASGWPSTTFHAEIIWRHNQEDTVLAATVLAVASDVYERFSQNLDGADPPASAGDALVLRVTITGTASGGVLYGPPDNDSYVRVPCY